MVMHWKKRVKDKCYICKIKTHAKPPQLGWVEVIVLHSEIGLVVPPRLKRGTKILTAG